MAASTTGGVKMSDKITIGGKIHAAATEGQMGALRDANGRKAHPLCGQTNTRVNASYAHPDAVITCRKCLVD